MKAVAGNIARVPQFAAIFADFIDPYRRMDYPIRALPALRVYSNGYLKEFESWFINGDIKLDVIFPANIRRAETQQFQDTISSALLQQFRRTPFFQACEKMTPGLNELGKRFDVDKSLGFDWGEDVVPLTQITVNFRLDLRIWDQYLENSSRTKEDPFERTLASLTRIVATIQGLRDDGTTEVSVPMDVKTT